MSSIRAYGKVILVLGLVTQINFCYSQERRISHIDTEQETVIEFLLNDVTYKRINLIESSRYASLKYPSSRKGKIIQYDISHAEPPVILRSFFLEINPDTLQWLKPLQMHASSSVEIQHNYAIVFDNLYLDWNNVGPLGIRSAVTVYNESGEVVATLPENNDGFIEASITKNGKYLATLYGDNLPEVEFTLLPSPGFKLFDLQRKTCLVNIPSGEFDVYPTSVSGNILIEVLRFRGGEYQYHFYDTDSRIVYKRSFSGADIGNFVGFTKDGICIREGKDEKLLSFASDFTCSNF
jgi:hypothetical protein